MKPAISNYVHLEITSADIPKVLDDLISQGITLWEIDMPEPLTALVKVSAADASTVRLAVTNRGDACRIQSRSGYIWMLLALRRRLPILLGICIVIFLTAWLPTKILFFEVNGCEGSLENELIDIVCNEGVYFGSDTGDVHSAQLKNSIINKLPEIEWAGVTVRGCVAVIDVRQGSVVRDTKQENSPVCHVVAATDGIVESVTVETGKSYCVPGQVVRKGQILISGYEDCTYSIKASRASGEIFAYTQRDLQAVSPLSVEFRASVLDHKTDFSFLIGKKHINLNNNSGISGGSCVKMYSKEYLSLPGGFQLPIALVREDYYTYECVSDSLVESDYAYMQDFARDYTIDQMLAGQILKESSNLELTSELALYTANYACREQIGIIKNEETLLNGR